MKLTAIIVTFDVDTVMGRSPRHRGQSSSTSRPSIHDTNLIPSRDDLNATISTFTCIPELETLRSAADTYFRLCHNHPYVYFEESEFREKLEERCLPTYFLLTFLAIVARYSNDPYFQDRNALAMERFAGAAWNQISGYIFSNDGGADIETVQATSMMAMNDFLLGRHQSAWVKIGLCVRLAQTLRLGEQSAYDEWPDKKRREGCMTFWSVYLLDKLVSVGRHRPPTILDADCTVSLPSSYFGSRKFYLPLSAITQPVEGVEMPELDDFALTILMASTLGRTIRYCLQHVSNSSYALWDSRSEFSNIHGTLLNFETFSNSHSEAFDVTVDFGPSAARNADFAGCGHFLFAHVLYHLNHCILHHPFLLKYRFQASKTRAPCTFMREAISRNKEHADRLVSILKFLQSQRLPLPSFYGFCAVIAGVIQCLHSAATSSDTVSPEGYLFQICLDFLEHAPQQYVHFRRMSVVLRTFQPSSAYANAIVSPITSQNCFTTQNEDMNEFLWNTFDYGWLCDAKRPSTVEDPFPGSGSEFGYRGWESLLGADVGGLLMPEGAALP